jgi:predicted DNA-binding transcriptional regulator YafY
MSYLKRCTTCGQRISMREMPAGQWVAFDPSTDNPHKHFDEPPEHTRHQSPVARPTLKEVASSREAPITTTPTVRIPDNSPAAVAATHELLSSARSAQKVATIIYISRDDEVTRRDIEVLEIDSVYCYAFCRLRQDFRQFRLDRIQYTSPTTDSFQPRRWAGRRFGSRSVWANSVPRPRPTEKSYEWLWWIIALFVLWLLLRR